MKCPTCNFVNEPVAKFCTNCGTGLAVDCVGCGHRNPPTARYCADCGQSLTAKVAPTMVPPVPTSLHAQSIDTRAARDGMRKVVSILFTDVVDSTRLMQEHDPEEAAARVEVLLATMRQAVGQYDGTVNKVQGDGLMAIFGAPRPQEDHAVRACCAALAMR